MIIQKILAWKQALYNNFDTDIILYPSFSQSYADTVLKTRICWSYIFQYDNHCQVDKLTYKDRKFQIQHDNLTWILENIQGLKILNLTW